MIIYEDIITGCELCSDAFKPKLVDDIVYEVDCAMVTIKPGADVNIGANPSAEEAEEAVEDGSITVNNVVHSFRLQPTSFSNKKDYLVSLKTYMKDVKGKLQESSPDRVEAFEKGAAAYAKKIVANFKDFEFFTGEKMETEEQDEKLRKASMVLLLNYREDGVTPYLTIWKDGVREVKV